MILPAAALLGVPHAIASESSKVIIADDKNNDKSSAIAKLRGASAINNLPSLRSDTDLPQTCEQCNYNFYDCEAVCEQIDGFVDEKCMECFWFACDYIGCILDVGGHPCAQYTPCIKSSDCCSGVCDDDGACQFDQ